VVSWLGDGPWHDETQRTRIERRTHVQFWKRYMGVALLGLGLCMGCGGNTGPTTKIPKEQYEKVWSEILANYKKKKVEKKHTDEVLKKNNIELKEWESANVAYGGMPLAIKKEYEKMSAIPMPKGNIPAQSK
jgi:hypothetical protein